MVRSRQSPVPTSNFCWFVRSTILGFGRKRGGGGEFMNTGSTTTCDRLRLSHAQPLHLPRHPRPWYSFLGKYDNAKDPKAALVASLVFLPPSSLFLATPEIPIFVIGNVEQHKREIERQKEILPQEMHASKSLVEWEKRKGKCWLLTLFDIPFDSTKPQLHAAHIPSKVPSNRIIPFVPSLLALN